MNDLEQFEINALRADARIDSCTDSDHRDSNGDPLPVYTRTYLDGAKATECSYCGQGISFVEGNKTVACDDCNSTDIYYDSEDQAVCGKCGSRSVTVS